MCVVNSQLCICRVSIVDCIHLLCSRQNLQLSVYMCTHAKNIFGIIYGINRASLLN